METQQQTATAFCCDSERISTRRVVHVNPNEKLIYVIHKQFGENSFQREVVRFFSGLKSPYELMQMDLFLFFFPQFEFAFVHFLSPSFFNI